MRKIVDTFKILLVVVFLLLPQVVFGQSRALDLIKWDSGGLFSERVAPYLAKPNLSVIFFEKNNEVPNFALSVYTPNTSSNTDIATWRKDLIQTWLIGYNRMSGVSLEEVFSRYPPVQGTQRIGDLGVADTVTFHLDLGSGREFVLVFLETKINGEGFWLTFILANGYNGYHPGMLNTSVIQKFLASFKLASPPRIAQVMPINK
jgi:hypothetical protein